MKNDSSKIYIAYSSYYQIMIFIMIRLIIIIDEAIKQQQDPQKSFNASVQIKMQRSPQARP